jgi:hypothetical protein
MVLLLSACAHAYHYVPEISGDGATWSQGGIVFALPATRPLLKMTMTTRSLKQAPKKANLPEGTQVIHVRMQFEAVAGSAPTTVAYLEPQDQKLLTFGDVQTPPSIVRASAKHRPRILLNTPQQIVEFYYALPQGISASDLQWFSIQWKVWLADGRSEQQVTRFDRHDAAPQSSNGFDDYTQDSVGFLVDDWGWWVP